MARGSDKLIGSKVRGQVKFFKSSEGYGFIEPFDFDRVDEDIFFHISKCHSDVVHEDWWMKFDVRMGKKGPRAVDVRRTSAPSEAEQFNKSTSKKRSSRPKEVGRDSAISGIKAGNNSESSNDESDENEAGKDSEDVVGSKNDLLDGPM